MIDVQPQLYPTGLRPRAGAAPVRSLVVPGQWEGGMVMCRPHSSSSCSTSTIAARRVAARRRVGTQSALCRTGRALARDSLRHVDHGSCVRVRTARRRPRLVNDRPPFHQRPREDAACGAPPPPSPTPPSPPPRRRRPRRRHRARRLHRRLRRRRHFLAHLGSNGGPVARFALACALAHAAHRHRLYR